MESTPATKPTDAASAATAMLVRNLASTGYIPDPAVSEFLGAMDGSAQLVESPSPVPTSSIPTLGQFHEEQAKAMHTMKLIKNTEIAMYILASQGNVSMKEIADHFKVTPATISRIMGTDGFQYILAEQAKKMAAVFKSQRSTFEGQLMAVNLLAIDRIMERIQVSNDTELLLKVISEFSALLGMGKQASGPSTQVNVNNFGVTGDHLRHAVAQQRAGIIDVTPERPALASPT